jgi:hypothetical protein
VLGIEAEFMDAARNTVQPVARYAQPEFAYAIVNWLSLAPRSQESRPSSVVSDSEWTRALRKYLSGQPSLKPRHDSCRAVAVPPDAFRLRRDVVKGRRFHPRCFKPWLGACDFPAGNRTRVRTRCTECWECRDGSYGRHAQSPGPEAAIRPCECSNGFLGGDQINRPTHEDGTPMLGGGFPQLTRGRHGYSPSAKTATCLETRPGLAMLY